MIDFLKEYGTYILSAVIIIFDLVVFPVFKSKLNKANKKTALFEIIEKLPDYILEAEANFTSGKSKLAYVLQKCHLDCVISNTTYDEDLITSYIEDILETPQSHN